MLFMILKDLILMLICVCCLICSISPAPKTLMNRVLISRADSDASMSVIFLNNVGTKV